MWFAVNLGEETVKTYLSVAIVIGETSGCCAYGIHGVLWQKSDFTERRVEEWDNMVPRLGVALDLSLWETVSQSERSGCCSISRHLPTVAMNSFISPFPAMWFPQRSLWVKSRAIASAGRKCFDCFT